MLQLFVIAILCVGSLATSAGPRPITLQFWPNYESNNAVRLRDHTQLTKIEVGTPSQSLYVYLQNLPYVDNFLAPVGFGLDPFQPNASSTLVKLGTVTPAEHRKNEQIVADVVKIGNTVLKGIPFQLYTYQSVVAENYHGLFLSRPVNDDKHHFLSSILKNYKEKVVVIGFEKVKRNQRTAPGLIMTIGGRPSFCKQDWKYKPVVKSKETPYNQWLVRLDGVTVGNQKLDLNEEALVDFSIDETLGMQFQYMEDQQVLKNLNGDGWVFDNEDYFQIPCNVKKDIVLDVSGFKFRFKPEDYVERYYDQSCHLKENGHSNYRIPYNFLHDKCLLLDYENKRVGLASRK